MATYEHGWPWTFAERPVVPGGNLRPRSNPKNTVLLSPDFTIVWWSVPDAWPLPGDNSCWHIGALVGDLLVAMAILVSVALASEKWIQRRGGFGHFQIRDVLVVLAVAAVALSWWRWNAIETKENWAAIAILNQSEGAISREVLLHGEGMVGYTGVYWAYTGPEWLSRLIGSPEFMRSFLFRVEKIAIDTRYLNEEGATALCHLDDLEEIWVRGSAADLPPSLLSGFSFSRVEVPAAYSGAEIPRYAVWVKK